VIDAPLRVLIAGGGVAGLEAMLALDALAGDRVALTLLDPGMDFVYRPMSVAVPFAAGHPTRHPLADLAAQAAARHVRDRVERVDPGAHLVRTSGGLTLPYDALVLALGAQERAAYEDAVTVDPLDTAPLAGVLREIDAGAVRAAAVVVPPGPHWTLPAYELGLLIAGRARHDERGRGRVAVVVVVPEPEPLAIFGPAASAAIRDELAHAGVGLEAGRFAEVRGTRPATVILHPGGRRLEVDRVVALPRLAPRPVPGVGDDFLAVDGFGRVRGIADVYAVGDGTSFPVKQGGLAAQQADAAAAHLAARAGAAVRPAPFRPVLRGRLLTGRGDRWLRRDADHDPVGCVADHALWWPPDKIAGHHLAHAFAVRDPAAGLALQAPPVGTEVEVLVAALI
jgi:sulfide:quinone oxidoreductase